MSTPIPSNYYHFNAHGHGLSAHFHRPIEHLIDVQAATSLPTTGGHGHSRVENFRFREFISFRAAYSHVSGSRNPVDDTYTTLVTATVEGLNLLDVVTADRIVARLATQHPTKDREPEVRLVGSKFENLQIAGCKVDLELDYDFFDRLNTFETMLNELASNPQFKKMAEDPFQTGTANKLPDIRGVLLCSLVKNMETTCPGVTRHGHCFVVPHFGKIYLGELLAWHGSRTLTMLRFELGSPISGTGSTGEATVNGSPWP
jgi:hypothetical protein